MDIFVSKNTQRIAVYLKRLVGDVQHILKNTLVLHESVDHLTHMNEVMAEMANANFAEMRYHDHGNKKEMRKLVAQTRR